MKQSITRNLTADDKEASKRLKKLWNAKKSQLELTQVKIAEQLEITQGMFSAMLNEHVAIPKYLLLKIAKILEVHPAEINPSVSEALQVSETELKHTNLPVLFNLSNTRPDKEFIKVSRRQAISNGYTVEVNGDDYQPFYSKNGYIIVEPAYKVTEGDKVFVRLQSGVNLIATFVKIDSGRYYFNPITDDAPVNPEGYQESDLISVHFVSGYNAPRND